MWGVTQVITRDVTIDDTPGNLETNIGFTY